MLTLPFVYSLTFLLFAYYSGLKIFRLWWIGSRYIVFELLLHPLTFFFPLSHRFNRYVLPSFIKNQWIRKKRDRRHPVKIRRKFAGSVEPVLKGLIKERDTTLSC